MNTFKTLIKLSRPRFWLYLAGPYVIGYTAGTSNLNDFFTWQLVSFLLFFLIPANIFIYGVNDLFDEDTDKLNTKKQQQETFVTKHKKPLYVTAVILSFISALTVINYQNDKVWQLMWTFLLLGFFYSASPLRFKAKPILDSASNILYGIPGIIGYVQNSNRLPTIEVWIAIFCWTFAMHLFSAIPDIKPDSEANINTTATWLGEKNSLHLCAIMWFISAYIAVTFSSFFLISFVYFLIPLFLSFSKKYSIEKVYWWFPWINAAMGTILFFYMFAHLIE